MRAILTWHSIDASGSPISVSVEQFRAQCAFLASGRVRVLPLLDLAADRSADDAVALTFDDAFLNTADVAWPILEAHGLTATIFVVSGHVGGRNTWGGQVAAGIPTLPLMGWDRLGALVARGASLGAHTHRHPPLAGLSLRDVSGELDECRSVMRTQVGVDPRSFAYPYGAVDSVAITAVRDRFDCGCGTELRPLAADDDPACLPRLDMFYFRQPGALDRWGSLAFSSRLWVRRVGRQARAWWQPPSSWHGAPSSGAGVSPSTGRVA